jgi:MFS family permease
MKDNLRQMYAIGVMAFILSLSTLVGVPVLPGLSKELGASTTEIPIVISAALATVVVAQFFTGILADRYSKRSLILIGALMGSGSSFLCVVATHWVQLVAFRIIGGVADAIAMPALLAITASLGRDKPGKFFGILRSSQGLSFVIGPALGSLFSLVSFRMPFVVDGVLSFLAFIVVLAVFQDRERVSSEHDLSLFRGLGSVFSNRQVYLYLLMGISGIFAFAILYSFVPTKSELIGLDAWQIGMILSGGAVIFSFVSYVVGTLSDRFGRRVFAVVAQLIVVASGVGLVFSGRFSTLIVFYALFSVGETITYLLCFVYATDVFDREYIGASMAAFDSLMDLSLFVGPLIAISVYRAVGRIEPILLIAVLPAAAAFFATAAWLPRGSSSRETQLREEE